MCVLGLLGILVRPLVLVPGAFLTVRHIPSTSVLVVVSPGHLCPSHSVLFGVCISLSRLFAQPSP